MTRFGPRQAPLLDQPTVETAADRLAARDAELDRSLAEAAARPQTLLPPISDRGSFLERVATGSLISERSFNVLQAGIENNFVNEALFRLIARKEIPADPDFALDEAAVDQLSEGLPEHFRDQFLSARSMDEALLLREQLQQRARNNQILQEAGGFGVFANVGAAILDPAFFVAGAAVGPLIGLGGAATRLTQISRAGLLAAGTEGGLEAFLVTQDPDRSPADAAFAAIAAGGLTAGLGGAAIGIDKAIRARRLRKATELDEVAKALEGRSTDDMSDADIFAMAESKLSDKGRAQYAEVLEGRSRDEKVRRLIDDFEVDPEEAERIADAWHTSAPREAKTTLNDPTTPGLEEIDDTLSEVIDAATSSPQRLATRATIEVFEAGFAHPDAPETIAALRRALIERFGLSERKAQQVIRRAKKQVEFDDISGDLLPTGTRDGGQPFLFTDGDLILQRAAAEADAIDLPIIGTEQPGVANRRAAAETAPPPRSGAANRADQETIESLTEGLNIPDPDAAKAKFDAGERLTNEEGAMLGLSRNDVAEFNLTVAGTDPVKPSLLERIGRNLSDEKRAELGRLNDELARRTRATGFSGFDPTLIPLYARFGSLLIEAGARNFEQWARLMVAKFGEAIRPRLRELWDQAQADAGIDTARGIEPQESAKVNTPKQQESGSPAEPNPELDRKVAAALEPEAPSAKRQGDFHITLPNGVGDVRKFLNKARISMAGVLERSDSLKMRLISRIMPDNAISDADGFRAASGEEFIKRNTERYFGRFVRSSKPSFNQWFLRNRQRVNNRTAAMEDFYAEVTKAVRRPRGVYTQDPDINRAADTLRDLNREMIEQAHRHGVLTDVDPNDTYITRLWSRQKADKMVSEVGLETVHKLIATALMRGTSGMEQELADRLAPKYLRMIRSDRSVTGLDKAAMTRGLDARTLATLMRDELGDAVDEAEITSLVNDIERLFTSTQSKSPREAFRIRLDETTTIDAGGDLNLEDLFENNAMALTAMYTHQISGAMAREEIFRIFNETFDENVATWQQLRRSLINDMQAQGVDQTRIDSDIAKFDTLQRLIAGRPLAEKGRFTELLRNIRLFNFIRIQGSFIFAQIADLGELIGSVGVRSIVQQTPAFGRILSRARDGKLSSALAEELELLGVAGGTGRLRDQIYHRFDLEDDLRILSSGKLNRTLRRGTRIANDISLMAPWHIGAQRFSGVLSAQRWVNLARSNRTLNKGRLGDLGLDQKQADAISEQIRKHVETGGFGRVESLNIDNWTDPQAAADFVQALNRMSRDMVLEPNIGQMSRWMTTDMGRAIIQFRSFPVAALDKLLLRKLALLDATSLMQFTYSLFAGAAAYVAQQNIRAIGRDDEAEFREKFLSPQAIGAAAFRRAGASSFLPDLTDTALGLTGNPALFNYRTSGLDSSLLSIEGLFGNPTTQFVLGDIPKAIRGGASAAGINQSRGFTRADARAATRLLPFQNLVGIQNMLEAVAEQAPERAPRDISRRGGRR